MTEGQFLDLLRARYDRNAYALIPQVRNGTGFVRGPRTADALAVSLWPSRGIGVEGFEFKDSRTDWLKELKQPAKAEEIGRFCARWWLVASDESIVKDGELPGAWGLMVAKGEKLKVVKQAPNRDVIEPTWLFVASVFRAAVNVVTDEADIERRISKAAGEAADRARAHAEAGYKRRESEREDMLKRLFESVKVFEEKSGIRLDTDRYWGGHPEENRKIGEAVKFILDGGINGLTGSLKRIAETAESIQKQARSVIALETAT